jgi:hypothetical protein
MKNQYSTYIAMAVLSVLLLIVGCASRGKLASIPKGENDAQLTHLTTYANQYIVHYHGNSEKMVSGILFDPINDGKHIQPEGVLWNEVSNPETIADIIDTISRADFPGYFSRLKSIVGPEGDAYGYLFTGWTYVSIKPVDENTVRVFGLKGPPEYEDVTR